MRADQYSKLSEIEERFWWHVATREALDHEIRAALQSRDSSRILDVGCGTGFNVQFLSKYGNAMGLDYAAEAMQLCREQCIPFVRASAMSLPFQDEVFDLVSLIDVIYHAWVTDDVALLRESWRVLKPNGVIVIHVAALECFRRPSDDLCYTRHRYSRPELVHKLRQAGFDVQRCTYRNLVLAPLALASKVLSGRGVNPEDELKLPPEWLNKTMLALLRAENAIMHMVNLPFGVSLMALARKESAVERH